MRRASLEWHPGCLLRACQSRHVAALQRSDQVLGNRVDGPYRYLGGDEFVTIYQAWKEAHSAGSDGSYRLRQSQSGKWRKQVFDVAGPHVAQILENWFKASEQRVVQQSGGNTQWRFDASDRSYGSQSPIRHPGRGAPMRVALKGGGMLGGMLLAAEFSA